MTLKGSSRAHHAPVVVINDYDYIYYHGMGDFEELYIAVTGKRLDVKLL